MWEANIQVCLVRRLGLIRLAREDEAEYPHIISQICISATQLHQFFVAIMPLTPPSQVTVFAFFEDFFAAVNQHAAGKKYAVVI